MKHEHTYKVLKLFLRPLNKGLFQSLRNIREAFIYVLAEFVR